MKKVFLLLSVAALATSATATTPLGGLLKDEAGTSVRVMASSAGRSVMTNYTTKESVVSGANVTQYVDAKGYVFAVSWSGVMPPPLNVVLGNYANIKKENLQGSGNYSSYDDGDVVIERKYTARDKSGVAYLKSELPEGFDISILFAK